MKVFSHLERANSMTTVIGLTFPFVHDSAACAIVDGRLVFSAEEERFTRHKHAPNEAPINALVATLKHLESLRIKGGDVDAFAINYDPRLLSGGMRRDYYIFSLSKMLGPMDYDYGSLLRSLAGGAIHGFDFPRLVRDIIRHAYAKAGHSLSNARIIPVAHHLAHAASAYYFSGFQSAAVLTVDGIGETDATVVWRVKNGEFERVLTLSGNQGQSMGFVYETASTMLGFGDLEGPGKVMGLAPYGGFDQEIDSRFKSIVKLPGKELPYSFDLRAVGGTRNPRVVYRAIANYLAAGLDLNWKPRSQVTKPVADFAWALQNVTERMVESIARWAKEETGESNLGLAGGVALNAKANMRLHYSRMFNEIFIFPNANDAGTPVGAAAYVYEHVLGQKMRHGKLEDAYLGPGYDQDVIDELVKNGKWTAERIGDDVGSVSDLVANGAVVAWYENRSEIGPRALGDRSIVASPVKQETWKAVNDIKGREFWRPLAPSLIASDLPVYFQDGVVHKFMILMLMMTEEGKRRAPAVCHVDGTARPQTVSESDNALWFRMISSFKERTGEGIVVNTSFNLAGEPLVETPRDALRSFALGGFDAMYLQGWLIKKRAA